MMTVIWDQSVNPDVRRWRGIGWQTMTEPGSAKPGRGGRRKRRRRAATRQAIRRIDRIRWAGGPDMTTASMWRLMRAWHGRPNKAHPPLGRRERRRRAKLRRRRARSEARSSARAFLLAMPAFYSPPCPRNMWREISRVAQRKTEQRRAEERRAARRTNEMTRALLEVGTRPRPIEIQTVRYPKPTPGS